MVAKTADLPNIRKLFVPDPGMIIADCDLSGADARVVAWEAEDEDLMDAFESGLKVHIKNARDVFPEKVKGWSDEAIKATDHAGGIYDTCKKGVHATNYGAVPSTLASRLGWTIKESEDFQRNWFGLHPGIRGWQIRVRDSLSMSGDEFFDKYGRFGGGKTVFNKFGYRRIFFDRVESCYKEALAWTPQSTVGLTTNKGAMKVRENLPWVEILLQVHDSLVIQFPRDRLGDRKMIRGELRTAVPYERTLVIPWGFAASTRSWGDAEAMQW